MKKSTGMYKQVPEKPKNTNIWVREGVQKKVRKFMVFYHTSLGPPPSGMVKDQKITEFFPDPFPYCHNVADFPALFFIFVTLIFAMKQLANKDTKS